MTTSGEITAELDPTAADYFLFPRVEAKKLGSRRGQSATRVTRKNVEEGRWPWPGPFDVVFDPLPKGLFSKSRPSSLLPETYDRIDSADRSVEARMLRALDRFSVSQYVSGETSDKWAIYERGSGWLSFAPDSNPAARQSFKYNLKVLAKKQSLRALGGKVSLTGRGSCRLNYQLPASPTYLKGEQKLYLTYTLTHYHKGRVRTYSQEYGLNPGSYPQTRSEERTAGQGSSGWRAADRDFASAAAMQVFVAPRTIKRSVSATSLAATGSLLRVFANIYPHADPSIAEQDGVVAIAYEAFDPDLPTLQATSVNMVSMDESGYTTHRQPSDTRAEFSPVCGFDTTGNIVCVWERVRDPGFATEDLTALAAELDIVFTTRGPRHYGFGDVETLTDNTVLDHNPMLAQGQGGELLLVWVRNNGNEFVGSSVSPDRLFYATWDGAAFSPPVQIPGTFANTYEYSLAYDGSEARLAYAVDGDGDFGTVGDQELEYLVFNGTSWSARTRVTADSVEDAGPKLAWSETGPELFWRRGDSLVRLTDWGTGAYEVVRTNCVQLGFLDVRPICAANGRLTLCWQGEDEQGVDLHYVTRDPATGVWSKDLKLTDDAPAESSFAGVTGTNGVLNVVCLKENPESELTDLYHITDRSGSDLALGTNALTVDPTQPLTGQTVNITCVVSNLGDTAVSGATVAFYPGDPTAGGTLVGTFPVSPTLLPAGATGTAVLAAWSVPTNLTEGRVFARVDPDDVVDEYREENNTALLHALQPDLEVLSAEGTELSDGSLLVHGSVLNAGTITATNFQISVECEGEPLYFTYVPALPPGQITEMQTLVWPLGEFQKENFVVWIKADSIDQVVEWREDNNARSLGGVSLATPVFEDTDDDGMADEWERDMFQGLSRDGAGDFDGDGSSDIAEFAAGTNAQDPNSHLATGLSAPGDPSSLFIRWEGRESRTYRVQYASRLNPPDWRNLSDEISAAGDGELTFEPGAMLSTNSVYFRVIVVP